MRLLLWMGCLSLLASGCANGIAQNDDSSLDGGGVDGTPSGDSGNCPTGRSGPGCTECAGGFHACGPNCQQDHANTPDAGCTKSCGQPCDTPANATAKCTSDGLCDFTCNASYDQSDAGCDCPQGTIDCGGTCQQCCTDTDCPSNMLCQGGSCAGCQPGYGDCNNDPNDGCEVHLNSTSNCGSCGHSCCGSICGCGFLGLGGESCNANGNSFKCGC